MRKGFERFLSDRIYYPGISAFNEPQRIAHQRTRQISWENEVVTATPLALLVRVFC